MTGRHGWSRPCSTERPRINISAGSPMAPSIIAAMPTGAGDGESWPVDVANPATSSVLIYHREQTTCDPVRQDRWRIGATPEGSLCCSAPAIAVSRHLFPRPARHHDHLQLPGTGALWRRRVESPITGIMAASSAGPMVSGKDFDPVYVEIFLRSVRLALTNVLITLVHLLPGRDLGRGTVDALAHLRRFPDHAALFRQPRRTSVRPGC